MHYRFAILDLCDECRMYMMKTPAITAKYAIKDMGQGATNNCEVCGKNNVFTMRVLTDYRVDPNEAISLDLKKQKRSFNDGFALLLLEDQTESK